MNLGTVFADGEVARLYRHRAPYPDGVLSTLRGLLVAPRMILDIGAGTGALARPMTEFADRVDAVEPSRAMVREGQRLPRGTGERLTWIVERMEDAHLSGPYGLITAGASLHWLDLDLVFPRLRDALAPEAFVAVVDTETEGGPERAELDDVIRTYSTVEHHAAGADLLDELERAGRFVIRGRHRTAPILHELSIDDYIGMLHSTSDLARSQLGDRASQFDADVRAVFARRRLDAVRRDVRGTVIWGRPT